MEVFVKNMVSSRCIMTVQNELTRLGLTFGSIDLGQVEITGQLPAFKRAQLGIALKKYGLELMEDTRGLLIEKIKNAVIQIVHYTDSQIKIKFSTFLSEKLGYD